MEKKLFTPGPLGVSATVKDSLRRDLGSRDAEFIAIVRSVRETLLQIAGLDKEIYTSILVQGSGTFAVESVLNSSSDRSRKILILSSGAYGKRMQIICEKASIPNKLVVFPENEPVDIDTVRGLLKSEDFGAVTIVHCETTSGVINPVEEIGHVVKSCGNDTLYIIDAMSSFGGVEIDWSTADFVISSANKCLQGIPGFAFVLAKKMTLEKCKGRSTSLSLDLVDQWEGLESNGQFRFTPPTHCILAFHQALKELETEGGVSARTARYKKNNGIIKTGMSNMGFGTFVQDRHDGHIITSFMFPNDPKFSFETFYNLLSDKGQLIYPGKVTNADCFRIGNIGHLFPEDMEHLLLCIKDVLDSMGVQTEH